MEKNEFESLLAAVHGVGSELAQMREDMETMRADIRRLADALEILAQEQARIREGVDLIGRRVSRVEAASADQWAAIDRLRPQH